MGVLEGGVKEEAEGGTQAGSFFSFSIAGFCLVLCCGVVGGVMAHQSVRLEFIYPLAFASHLAQQKQLRHSWPTVDLSLALATLKRPATLASKRFACQSLGRYLQMHSHQSTRKSTHLMMLIMRLCWDQPSSALTHPTKQIIKELLRRKQNNEASAKLFNGFPSKASRDLV